MLIYWLMFCVPAALALMEGLGERRIRLAWPLATAALIVLIGFRWETGGDWGNYDRMVQNALWIPTPFSLLSDPGFRLLTIEAARSSVGLLLITVTSGVLMGIALTRFCLAQPRPWLCLAVAIPYLVVVMGMGYIRQGMAISFLMMGLVSLRDGHILRYSLWVLAGAMFHSTALILLPLGVMVSNTNIALRVGLTTLILVLLAYAVASTRAETLVANYVDAEMTSSGAAIRLSMTALPGVILLIWRPRFDLEDPERSVWTLFAAASLAALAMLFVFRSSTVLDRLGLYLLPLQCFVYSRAPGAFGRDERHERLIVIAILVVYALAFFTWLNFADNVDYWIPYRFYFLEDGPCLEC